MIRRTWKNKLVSFVTTAVAISMLVAFPETAVIQAVIIFAAAPLFFEKKNVIC